MLWTAAIVTFREVLEAVLIIVVARVGVKQMVWAAGAAGALAAGALIAAMSLGLKAQQWLAQEWIEGVLMIVTAVFMVWAVFWLHRRWGKWEGEGAFGLVFTAVLREGLEIVVFLAGTYLSARPGEIIAGVLIGTVTAVLVGVGLVKFEQSLPARWVFKMSSVTLVLMAGWLVIRGMEEILGG